MLIAVHLTIYQYSQPEKIVKNAIRPPFSFVLFSVVFASIAGYSADQEVIVFFQKSELSSSQVNFAIHLLEKKNLELLFISRENGCFECKRSADCFERLLNFWTMLIEIQPYTSVINDRRVHYNLYFLCIRFNLLLAVFKMLSQSRVDQCSEMRHMGLQHSLSTFLVFQSSGKSHCVLLESQDFDLYIYIF